MTAATEILASAFGISRSSSRSRSSSKTRASSQHRSSADLGPRPLPGSLSTISAPAAGDAADAALANGIVSPTSPNSFAHSSAFSSPPVSSNTSTASLSRSSSGRRKTRHTKTSSLVSGASPLGAEPLKGIDSVTGIVVPRMRESASELAKIEPSRGSPRSSMDSVRFNGFVKGNMTPPESVSRTSLESGGTGLSNDWPCHPGEITPISSLDTIPIGTEVTFRARIETQRPLSKVLDFLLLRDQTHSVQGVLTVDADNAELVRWVRRLSPESLVQITGFLKAPPEPIRSATQSGVEVDIQSVHLVNAASNLPFTNYKPPEALRNRLGARILDLRHPANQAVFRVRSLVTRKFRETLEERGFVEINTPKLQPAATESGAAVFKVNYFGRKAFLAQSPQLAKQMSISADFGRVFEVGPVFRAENSNTHRHLTEYTGLDIEMAIENDYHEVIDVLDDFLKSVFEGVYAMPEVEVIRKRWPSKEFKWLDETLILPFSEGIQMLRDDGRDVEEEDLSTPDEMRLGQLILEKYNTDYYILDRFPASARPFYTHKDPENPKYTRSFDIFLRGQEICSGGQRIHIADELRANMAAAGMSDEGMEDYLSAFDLGAPPHAGAGLGLERIVAWMLELGDVRYASLFHRDPRSLPERAPALPHPEADTTKPHLAGTELPLEKLIANYGDASNTSWLDDRFRIWRHSTGAAIGYVPQEKFAMVTGDPLCDPTQYTDVVRDFVKFVVQDLHLTPIWLLVSYQVQKILARELKWRTLSCTEEQRVDADHHTTTTEMATKIRRVEREGIKVHEVKADNDFVSRVEPAIEKWKGSRKGKQVHLTEVRPWVDMEHRRYFAAEKDGQVLAMVVLHRLAPRYGWQVKWALDFPGATNGAIEAVVDHALNSVTGRLTFGAGVSEKLTPGEHMSGMRARFLAATYRSIVDSLGLRRKATFRTKFGALGEEVYICYPKHGVGLRDLQQIIKFFQD